MRSETFGTNFDTNRIFHTSQTQPTFQQLIALFERVIEEEHKLRDARTGKGLNWLRLELQELLNAINWERAQRNLNAIQMRQLLFREMGASGHSDYAHKLALYAAELVLSVMI